MSTVRAGRPRLKICLIENLLIFIILKGTILQKKKKKIRHCVIQLVVILYTILLLCFGQMIFKILRPK